LLLFNSIVHKVYIWKWLYFSFIGGFDKKSQNINTANISYFRGYSNLIYTIIYVKLPLFKPFLQLKWLQNDRRLILCFRWKWVKFITFGNEQSHKSIGDNGKNGKNIFFSWNRQHKYPPINRIYKTAKFWQSQI
jgi:hypothetical protein